jgi:thiamine biosynthesis protein ThiS
LRNPEPAAALFVEVAAMNERMRFEREIASLQATPGESEVRGAGTASLVLDRVETGHFAANFRPKASGLFRAYFCRRFPSTSMVLTIAGRVLIEKSGVKRPFEKPDLKTFPRLAVTMRVRPTGGVSAAAGGTRRVKADGTFEVSASAALEKSPRRISVRLDLEWSSGKKVSTECWIDYSPLDCFLAVIDRHEATRPAGQTHFEFLSSVRKMFQPAQGSPLASIFPLILDRTRKVPILAALNTPVGNTVKQFETLEINGEARTIPPVSNVRQLLEVLGISENRLAVELNREIVRRRDWEHTPVCNLDRVEIVQFVGGG